MFQDAPPKAPVYLSAPALPTTPDITLAGLLVTAWRNKLLIGSCVALFVLLGGYYAFVVATPKFATGTTLALQLRNEQLIDIDKVISGVSSDEEAINTELEVIKSRGLLEKLVAELDLLEDPEFNTSLRPQKTFALGRLKTDLGAFIAGMVTKDAPAPPVSEELRERRILIDTVDELRAAIDTEHLRDTYIFRIRVTTEREMKSARIANALADLYIREQIVQKFEATEHAVTWLAERVAELNTELEEKQSQAETMRSDIDLVSGAALEMANQKLRSLRLRFEDAEVETARLLAQNTAMKDLQSEADPETLAALANDPILNRILARMQSQDPESKDLFDARVQTLILNQDTEVSRADQKLALLEDAIVQAEAEMSVQSEQLIQLQQLERDLVSTQTLYETFLTRLKETSVQRGLQQSDSRVLSEATPGHMVAPRRARLVIMSGILGLIFGAAVIALRQITNNGIRTSEDLQAFSGIPVMGRIPKMPIRKRQDLLPYLQGKPASAAAEAVRNLRTSLLLNNLDNPPQLIMSTSALPGEGKTTQSITLAHNLAKLDKRVLLIEGDVRRRTFQDYFEFSTDHPGLASVLLEETPVADVVVHDPGSGLDLLVGYGIQGNPADLFASDRFRSFLTALRDEYEYVVIDTPPVMVVPDALVIGQSVDSILMSVAWDRTPRAQVLQALSQLETVNLRPAGMVLSLIDQKKSMSRYGYAGEYGGYQSAYYSG